ncbi:MAG: alkaline phosphatase [Candidatus Atribacteria bacterium]|nr:alkaline phosphatase [Candidatus Atribacteria bacterium]
MVEGGRIDWAGHVNDAATSVREVQGFDQAVEVAASFYQKHSTETLVIVTADHETGGMSVDQNAFRPDLLSGQAVSYERFILILKSFEKFGTLIMAEVEKEQNAIEKSYTRSWQGEKSGGYDPFLVFLLHLRDEQAGIAWTTHGHSTVKVPVYALGVDADLFAGVQDNTDIFRVIRKIIAGGGETVEATNK